MTLKGIEEDVINDMMNLQTQKKILAPCPTLPPTIVLLTSEVNIPKQTFFM